MRVTNSMLPTEALRSLNKNYGEMIDIQRQVSTGKKIDRPSDSPVIANESAILKSDAERLAQFARNIDTARNQASDTETALMDINSSIQNIKELATQASNGTLSDADRQNIITEINQNKEQIMSLLNTSSSDKFIFGGFNTKLTPVENIGGAMTYNGVDLAAMTDAEAAVFKSQVTSIQISKGTDMTVSVTALDIIGYGEDNLFKTIDDMTAKLASDTFTADDIGTELADVNGHFNNVLNNISDIGGKSRRLDMVEDQIDETIFNVERLLSEVEDVDIEEAIIKYKLAEQAYNATLAVSAQTIKMTLLDYLR